MKKTLSLIGLIAIAMVANAQFTLTYDGNPIPGEGLELSTSSCGSAVEEDAILDMTLTNTSDAQTKWDIITEAPGGNTFRVSAVCAGISCRPGTENSATLAAGANTLISIHFAIPTGTTNNKTENFTFRLHNVTNDADDLSFNISLTYSSNGIEVAGIEKISNAYPNPAVSNVTIDFAVEGSAQLVLNDITGREVMQQTVSGNGSIVLNVESLHKGVYLYGIRQGNRQYAMKKLVVK